MCFASPGAHPRGHGTEFAKMRIFDFDKRIPMSPTYSILVADHDARTLEEIDASLSGQGYSTFLAETGARVMEIVRNELIHLSILDLFLPDIMALEILRRLQDTHHDIPCIMLARNDSKELRLEALGMGVCCMVSKPFEIELLKDVVGHVLSRYYRKKLH